MEKIVAGKTAEENRIRELDQNRQRPAEDNAGKQGETT